MTKIIDHQPIRFTYATECNLVNANWHQFAQYGDTTQWQMGLDPCANDVNGIKNGGFTTTSDWIVGTNWSIDTTAGLARKIVGASGLIVQSVAAPAGGLWRLTISVQVVSGSFQIIFGAFNTFVTETGDYTFWVGASGVTGFGVLADGASSGIITNVSAVPINQNFEAWLVDESGSDVHAFTSADFTYINGWLTHTIDWQTLAIANGCYTLEVSDPCICAQGGLIVQDFATNVQEWIATTGFVVGSGIAQFTSAGAAVGNISTLMSACDGISYDIEYTVAITGSATVTPAVGGTNGVGVTSTGTYTDTIVAGAANQFAFGVNATTASTVTIASLTITRTKRSRDYISVPIKVSTTPIDCTYLINFCCNRDNMGLGFTDTGFSPSVRLAAQYAHGAMTGDRNSYEFSNGRKATTYYRGRKNKSLRFIAPSYIHDALMYLGGYDHAYIDGNEVFVEDDEYPTISWNDQTDLGGVTLTLRDKEILIENRIMTSASKGCDPDGNLILLNGQTWLDPASGETITIG